MSVHWVPGIDIQHPLRGSLAQLASDNIECFGAGMRMHWCRRTRRPMAVVHAQQILGCAERRNGSDLRDLSATGCCSALGTESKEPRFASDLSGQRRQSVIADGVRVPAIRWCSCPRFIQRRETVDAPKQFAFGKLLDLHFRYGLNNILRLCGNKRRRRQKSYSQEERERQNNNEPITCWYKWAHCFSLCVYTHFPIRRSLVHVNSDIAVCI